MVPKTKLQVHHTYQKNKLPIPVGKSPKSAHFQALSEKQLQPAHLPAIQAEKACKLFQALFLAFTCAAMACLTAGPTLSLHHGVDLKNGVARGLQKSTHGPPSPVPTMYGQKPGGHHKKSPEFKNTVGALSPNRFNLRASMSCNIHLDICTASGSISVEASKMKQVPETTWKKPPTPHIGIWEGPDKTFARRTDNNQGSH